MQKRRARASARPKKTRVYRPSKFGEGIQPGTAEWATVWRNRAKAARRETKAKKVQEAATALLGWDAPVENDPRRGYRMNWGLSLTVMIAAFLYALVPVQRDAPPSQADNYLYIAPAASSHSSPILPDYRGRILRSSGARDAFKRRYPCPSTAKSYGPCPGYIIDHIKPLACGGADQPFNMQWQTIAQAKDKDKVELNCR